MNTDILFYFILYASVGLCVCAIILLCVALSKLYRNRIEKNIIKLTQRDRLDLQVKEIGTVRVNYGYREADYIPCRKKTYKQVLLMYIARKFDKEKYLSPKVRHVRGACYKRKINKSNNKKLDIS